LGQRLLQKEHQKQVSLGEVHYLVQKQSSTKLITQAFGVEVRINGILVLFKEPFAQKQLH
jgi:hypothetical protein